MAIQFSQSAQPNQNPYIERNNWILREELLDSNLFIRLNDVQEAINWPLIESKERRTHNNWAASRH